MEEKINNLVIEPYRKKRTFYHMDNHFKPTRMKLIQRLIDDDIGSILDVGCGHGLGSHEIMDAGIEYIGIDPIEENILQARLDNPEGDFRVGFMQELPFKDKSFDAVIDVTVWEILPTVEDMRVALSECMRVARRKYYSLNCTEKPRCFLERYMMVPPSVKLIIERVYYDKEKDKANYLWIIDLETRI